MELKFMLYDCHRLNYKASKVKVKHIKRLF